MIIYVKPTARSSHSHFRYRSHISCFCGILGLVIGLFCDPGWYSYFFIFTLHMEHLFSSDIIFSFFSFPLTDAGDFRHGCAGAGDEVYRSPDPGETDLSFPAEQQPALRQEQPPHQHVPLRPQRPKGTDVRGAIHSPILTFIHVHSS